VDVRSPPKDNAIGVGKEENLGFISFPLQDSGTCAMSEKTE